MGRDRAHRLDAETHRPAAAKDEDLPENDVPGKQTRVEQLLEPLTDSARPPLQKASAPGRKTRLDTASTIRVDFEDYRVLGLRGLLQRLGPEHPLRSEVLAAADRAVARRATLSDHRPSQGPTPSGHAMWRAAERHAVTLYRHAVDAGEVDGANPAIAAALEQRGSGQPLPSELCREMETELGLSLARVRVHTDAVAAQAALAVRAEAFTVGEDIFFAENAFAPATSAGRKLLAHELAHVAQALRGRAEASRGGVQLSRPSDSLEREADAIAERIEHNLARRDRSRSKAVDPFGTRALEAQLGERMSRLPGSDLTKVERPARPEVPSVVAERRDPLRATATGDRGVAEGLAAQMRRTFGASAGDVPIATDSTRPLAAEAEGVAVGEQVYIAPGFYDLETTAGRERLGHEVAHVLQQRRGRGLPEQLGVGERAGLEAEADRAGHAFARGEPFAVQGRAPAQVALFKGAAPTKAPAVTTTTIDLKAGGRIARKPPAPTAGSGAAAAKDKPKAKEQLIITYGGVQASNPFTIERDERGEAVRLVNKGKISLPASKYMKQLDLEISLGADGYVRAKVQGNGASAIRIGGLTVHGGTLTSAIDHGQLTYALDGATIALPRNIGQGELSIQGNGNKEPAFDASLTIKVPKLQPSTMRFHADANGYRAEGSAGVDIKKASGSVHFSLEKVGDEKALWSAAGSVGYSSERLSGQIGVQYNADGELSGEGSLDFQIADFLTGQATVALDKEGHVAVNGEIRPPAETQLFSEKKHEQTFFHKSVEFPIWGISIPAVGSVGVIAFIDGSMGYRVGVGAGVMRDIVLSGSYSTDPSVQPAFQITGEIFIPAYAELLISIGGGVKLDAFIAEVGGGIKIDGRAGLYGGLSVRPTLAYEGGKYRLMGHALLAGDVGLSAQVDAFVKLHVGKWMFSWEKEWDWKLGEWNKWLGLNLGMEADLDYTLGQPLSPDIFKLKKPDSLDVQGIAKSAMPQGGMPPQGSKGAQHQHTEFKQKGGGGAATPASAPVQPKLAGTPAGAAGHKNQDPKGKKVKPAKLPKSGPAKQAKGKDASQTGPNPKNKSKPSKQKLDATPIVEPFSMHGEPHQLIVQLGPSGHVDMASKRERLSVKVGHAVSKLIAKHASPEQISDLKEIGALAKKGDKMVATAKLTDKEGTTKVAKQIAAYGDKWQVHDLDEVAIKAPAVLVVPKPVRLEKPSQELLKALVQAHGDQVIYNKPGDPKELARRVLEKHKDATFDFASARLTLPSPQPAALVAAHSLPDVGRLLGEQTGVSKVITKEHGGDTELIGQLGASTTLGTAVVPAAKSLVEPSPATIRAKGTLAQDIANATTGQVLVNHSDDAKAATIKILRDHKDARLDVATGALHLPPVTAPKPDAPLKEVANQLAQQTGVSRITVEKTDKGVTLNGEINPSTPLAEIQADTQNRAERIRLAQAIDEFHQPFTVAQWAKHFAIAESTAYEDVKPPEIESVPSARGKYRLTPIPWSELKVQILERFRLTARKVIGVTTLFDATDLIRFCEGDPQLPKPPNVPPEFNDASKLATVLTDLVATKDIEASGAKYQFTPKPSRRYLPAGWNGTQVREFYYEYGSGYGAKRDAMVADAHTEVMAVIKIYEDADAARNTGDTREADTLQKRADAKWFDLRRRKIVAQAHSTYPGGTAKAEYNDTSKYHADHIKPLAYLWDVEGQNDAEYKTRQESCGGDANLQVMWGSDNMRKGSKVSDEEDGKFMRKPWVGPNFTDPTDRGETWNAGHGGTFRESM